MAALKFGNRVKETSTTTGTGTYSLAGAATGFQTFVAAIGTTNTCYYVATNDTDWEVGIGTVTDASPDTLSRDTILNSSNANNAVNWGAGTKTIMCTIPSTTGGLIRFQACSFFAYNSASDTVTTATVTTVVADTEVFDNGAVYDNATGKFTAPLAGLYHFTGSGNWTASPGSAAYIAIKNLTTGQEWARQGFQAVADLPQSVSTIVQCAASDEVAAVVYHAAGSDRTLYGAASGHNYTSFGGYLIAGQP